MTWGRVGFGRGCIEYQPRPNLSFGGLVCGRLNFQRVSVRFIANDTAENNGSSWFLVIDNNMPDFSFSWHGN